MWSVGAPLFNPMARVYNIRILLVGSVLLITWSALVWDFFSVGTGCLILVHHPLALWVGLPGLGVLDMALIVVELILVVYSSVGRRAARAVLDPFALWGGPYILLFLGPLIAAATFRLATLCVSSGRFWRQRLVFLGGCRLVKPSYTPWRILLSRSLARPLVRGEFIGIIILRALILSAIVVVIPFFAVYAIIWTPLVMQVHTTILSPSPATIGYVPFTQWNASVVFQAASASDQDFTGIMSPNVTISELYTADPVSCPSADRLVSTTLAGGGYSTQSLTVAECPFGWQDIGNITISFATDMAYIIYVSPGQGDPKDIVRFTEPIPIIPGAQLFALLTWTSRQIYTSPSSRLFGLFTVSFLHSCSTRCMFVHDWISNSQFERCSVWMLIRS
ncbi:hypothetical protein DFH06DRAFT_144308 [Mycena polygramma]|nr:hypothetical protein DFH06DRAFT_144308 [Mycena polygramma]